MNDPLMCPVCERGVSVIIKWRGIYVCVPCKNKYEKIEELLKNGQVLEGPRLAAVLRCFGNEEMDAINDSDTVNTKKRKVKRKKV